MLRCWRCRKCIIILGGLVRGLGAFSARLRCQGLLCDLSLPERDPRSGDVTVALVNKPNVATLPEPSSQPCEQSTDETNIRAPDAADQRDRATSAEVIEMESEPMSSGATAEQSSKGVYASFCLYLSLTICVRLSRTITQAW